MSEPAAETNAQESAHVQAVREAVAALNRGDVNSYAAAFDPDCRRWSIGLEQGVPAKAVVDTLRALIRAFSDFRLSDELPVGTGPYVTARWRLTGRHTAEFAGIEATGRSIDVRTCEVYQFTGDRILATWAYQDPAELFSQLSTSEDAP